MITRRHFMAVPAAGLALASTGLMRHALAQAGGKTIRLMLGVAPGAAPDVVARLLVDQMMGYGSPLIVDNRPGAAERIALEAFKNSPADGSGFMLTGSSPIAVLPHVYKKLKYDPPPDFMPGTTGCPIPFNLCVGPLGAPRV